MPKKYILTADQSSEGKIQRLLKTINTNASNDRKDALELLDQVKAKLKDLVENPPTDEQGNVLPTIDSFTKLIQSASIALNQAGIANEKLLKLATLLQKFYAEKQKSGGADTGKLNSSLFSQLQKISNEDDED
jgi:hypothetical protein